jgi:hypothetical protein
MVAPQITDHVAQAAGKLATRYRGLPLFGAWVKSHVQPLQTLEDAIYPILTAFDLDTADEARLLVIAKLVGQPPLPDVEELRLACRVRILVNRSNGRLAELARIAALLFGTAEIREIQPCHLRFDVPAQPIVPFLGASLLREAKAGGVGFALVASISGPDFTFADNTTDTSSSGYGDALDIDGTTGGRTSAVL